MFILEGPFVSDLLKETVIKKQIPILESKYSKSLITKNDGIFLSPNEVLK